MPMQMPIFQGVTKAYPLEQLVCQRSTGGIFCVPVGAQCNFATKSNANESFSFEGGTRRASRRKPDVDAAKHVGLTPRRSPSLPISIQGAKFRPKGEFPSKAVQCNPFGAEAADGGMAGRVSGCHFYLAAT